MKSARDYCTHNRLAILASILMSNSKGAKNMKERTGEAFEFGEQLTVLGGKLQPGMTAPAFTLDSFDPAAGALANQ